MACLFCAIGFKNDNGRKCKPNYFSNSQAEGLKLTPPTTKEQWYGVEQSVDSPTYGTLLAVYKVERVGVLILLPFLMVLPNWGQGICQSTFHSATSTNQECG